MFAKHFVFRNQYESGRFAVAMHDGNLIVKQLSGNCPTLNHAVKAIAWIPEVVESMNNATGTRRNPYTVQKRIGMSGCADYILREQRDTRCADYPIRARLHVSMRGKLNQGIDMWLGDFPPLFIAAQSMEQWDGVDGETVEEVPIATFDRWSEPRIEFLRIDENGVLVADIKRDETELYLGPEVLAKLAAMDEDDFEPYEEAVTD